MPTTPCPEVSGAPSTRRDFVPRRSHRKSRLGCGNCKKRKIKCDENRPSCKNCGSFSIACDYNAENLEHASSSGSTAPHAPVLLPRRRRGRPRKLWPAADPSSQNNTQEHPAPLVEEEEARAERSVSDEQAPLEALGFEVEELELLHHYTTTAHGLGMGNTWVEHAARVLIPQLGRAHRHLMSFILSFAALHLARLRPAQQHHWAAVAELHHTHGLRGVAQVLPALDAANCHAVYVSACFVCFCAFAKGPRRGEFLFFNDGDDNGGGAAPPAFLPLMRGVRQIVEAVGEAAVFSGPLRACPRPERADLPAGEQLHRRARVEWTGPVGRLRASVCSSDDAHAHALLHAVDDLAQCFRDTCGGEGEGAEGGGGKAQEQAILAWLFRISTQDGFVECLRQKRPLALLVLAHFAVLLKMLDHVWFMAGWADHILAAIRDIIGGEYREQLAWAMQEVGV